MFKSTFALKKLPVSIAMILMSSGVMAVEEKKSEEIIETIVISSNIEMPLREVATSVSVLNEDDLKKSGALLIQDVLRQLPSIAVHNAGGLGKQSSISIRGEEGFRTLIKIDGIDISDPSATQSTAQVQHLLTSGVGRVEVLRGPQGLMQGADAGGVILISTKSHDQGVIGGVGYELGAYGTSNTQANLGVANKTGDIFIAANSAKTDGFNAQKSDVSGEKDGYENDTVHARIGWNMTETLRAELIGRTTYASSQYDNCFGPINCLDNFNQTNSRAAISHKNPLGQNQIAFTNTEVFRDSFVDGIKSGFNFQGEVNRIEFSGNANWSDAVRLVYGFERKEEESANDYEEHGISRDQQAAYAEYQGKFIDQLFVTVGVRQDKTDDFGDYDTHRISAAYIIPQVMSGELKIKATSGTGFRLPSLYENATNSQYGGVALTPETSDGFDIGFEYSWNNRLQTELVYFNQQVEDQITYSNSSWTYVQEVPESKSKGVEWVTTWQMLDQLSLNANITRINAEDSNGNPRIRKPKLMANLGLDYQINQQWLIGVNYRTIQDRVDIGNIPLDDYELMDFRVRSEFSKSISGFLRIENLLDEKYVEVNGYNTPGQATYIGVDVAF